jgi:lantibiotic biosynthesis protein
MPLLHYFDKIIVRTPSLPIQPDANRKLSDDQLYISSPEFLAFHKSREGLKERKKEKLNLSLQRYITRARSRATPFGLLSGVGVGYVADESDFVLDEGGISRHTRFDAGYILTLIDYIDRIKEVRSVLRFYPNDTIYKQGPFFYYTELYINKASRKYLFTKIEQEKFLNKILSRASHGLLLEELCGLIDSDEFTLTEKEEFVNSIIDSRLLISELHPSVTGVGIELFLNNKLEEIEKRFDSQPIPKLLAHTKALFQKALRIKSRIDSNKIQDENLVLYQEIENLLKGIHIPLPEKFLFQTDYIQHYKSATLSKHIADRVTSGVNALLRLHDPFEISNLTKFKKIFQERWGDQEVPLLNVFDPDTGLAYPPRDSIGDISQNSLVEDLVILNTPHGKEILEEHPKTLRFWFEKITSALTTQSHIVITDTDLERFPEKDSLDLPPTLSILFSVHGGDQTSPIQIKTVGGSTGASLFSRFAFCSPEVYELCKEIAAKDKELHADKGVAEICHFPELRAGNIIQKPSFREIEITYLDNYTTEKEGITTLPVSDLFIRVAGGQIILRSKKLNKVIVPKLTNAHAYFAGSLPIYHFLCDLQYQGIIGNPTLHLSVFEKYLKYIPRVVYNNVILFPATWSLNKSDFSVLLNSTDLQQELSTFKNHWKLPRFFNIIEGENELLIDSNDASSIRLFLNELHLKNRIKIEEAYLENGQLIKSTNQNNFVSEMILSLYRSIADAPTLHNLKDNVSSKDVSFMPGSEWVYLKVYAGSNVVDKLITDLAEVFDLLKKKYFVSNIFFIRYKDPHFHLRLRLQLKKPDHYGAVIQELYQFFHEENRRHSIWKMQTDTYEREVERYGAKTIHVAEKIFEADSLLVSRLLGMLSEYELPGEFRWIFSMAAINCYFDIFLGNTIDHKLDFSFRQSRSFRSEFAYNKPLHKSLDAKFRAYKSELFEMLGGMEKGEVVSECPAVVLEIFKKFKEDLIECAEELYNLEKDQEAIYKYLVSYVHMHIIRVFKSQNRKHEFVLYEFLERYYRYQAGKIKHINAIFE